MIQATMTKRPPFDPALRGRHAVYRPHEVNHCPGCGRSHWHIGRVTAECAFCATALPLATEGRGSGTVLYSNMDRRGG